VSEEVGLETALDPYIIILQKWKRMEQTMEHLTAAIGVLEAVMQKSKLQKQTPTKQNG
jgi:hypothetical protein